MADRYWVGGTANWDGTAGTKWSATSGGAGGASVPTSTDDVFFDANSNTGSPITVTIAAGNAGAKSINCTGFTRTLAGTASLSVFGSVTLAAGMTFSHSGPMSIVGSGTLTSAGKSFTGVVTIGAPGITVGLGDAFTSTGNFVVSQGTFNTNNFNLTANNFNADGVTNVRAVNLGSSTITLNTSINLAATNLTFNAGTSQINLAGVSSVLGGDGQTFNNVSFTSTTISTGARSVTGAPTIANLTLTASANGVSILSFAASCTITGTLTCSGASTTQRAWVRSQTVGTAQTLTVGTLVASNCDFRDITLTGAASPASPSGAGDCGGNTNITFPAPKTVYRVGTDTTWAGSSSWALSSGGAGSNANFPLAQDTVVIDNNTALGGTLEIGITSSNYNTGTLDCSARTTALTLNLVSTVFVHGSYTLGSGITTSTALITFSTTFSGRGLQLLTTAGRTVGHRVLVTAPGGTVRFTDAFLTTQILNITLGTLDFNGFSVTASGFSSSTPNTRTITCGSNAAMTLTDAGAGIWNFGTTTGLTMTGTMTVTMTAATAKTFNSGGFNYPITLVNGGAGALTIIGSNTFVGLSNTAAPTSFLFTAGTTTTLTNWNINGTAGNLVTIGSPTAASHTLSKASGTVTGDYLSISRSNATGGATWNATNSVDGGNNTGWNFGGGPPPPPAGTGNFFMFFGEG